MDRNGRKITYKVTVNRSDKDNRFDDVILPALENVVVKIGDNVVPEGLKSAAMVRMMGFAVRAQITTDANNNITEVIFPGVTCSKCQISRNWC